MEVLCTIRTVKEIESPQESVLIGRASIANFLIFQKYSMFYLSLRKRRQIILDIDSPLPGHDSDFSATTLMMRD